MDRVAELNILYDIYGNLLTEKKRKIMDLYYNENLSLTEIAEEEGISRAAVHDSLKASEKSLEDYEQKLSLLGAYTKREKIVEELRSELNRNNSMTDKIEKLLTEIEE